MKDGNATQRGVERDPVKRNMRKRTRILTDSRIPRLWRDAEVIQKEARQTLTFSKLIWESQFLI